MVHVRPLVKRAAAVVAGSLLLSGWVVPSAHVDSFPFDWTVVDSAKLSTLTVKVKKKVTGTSKVVFTRKILGISMRSTGYYVNRFPGSVRRRS